MIQKNYTQLIKSLLFYEACIHKAFKPLFDLKKANHAECLDFTKMKPTLDGFFKNLMNSARAAYEIAQLGRNLSEDQRIDIGLRIANIDTLFENNLSQLMNHEQEMPS